MLGLEKLFRRVKDGDIFSPREEHDKRREKRFPEIRKEMDALLEEQEKIKSKTFWKLFGRDLSEEELEVARKRINEITSQLERLRDERDRLYYQ